LRTLGQRDHSATLRYIRCAWPLVRRSIMNKRLFVAEGLGGGKVYAPTREEARRKYIELSRNPLLNTPSNRLGDPSYILRREPVDAVPCAAAAGRNTGVRCCGACVAALRQPMSALRELYPPRRRGAASLGFSRDSYLASAYQGYCHPWHFAM
jgi:hypothetical protein